MGAPREIRAPPTVAHHLERAHAYAPSRYFGTPEGAIGVARSDCGDVVDA